MIYLYLLLTIASSFASDPYTLSDEEINPDSQEVLIKKPEKYLRHESMIYDLNTSKGIRDQRQYTGEDSQRLSIAGHIMAQYEHPRDLMGLDVTYAMRSKSYDRLWWGLQGFHHQTYFNSISSIPKSSTKPQRPGSAKAQVSGLGIGVSYRFKLILDFFETENIFETVDVYANYAQLKDDHTAQTFTGALLSTQYGLHKRTSSSFYYGAKFGYTIGPLRRKAEQNESASERTISVGWLSAAFEIGAFY